MKRTASMELRAGAFLRLVLIATLPLVAACEKEEVVPEKPADLILTNGRIYTLTWSDPGPDGSPAKNAPHNDSGWHPDAEAIAVKDGRILHAGTNAEVEAFQIDKTRVIDLHGATALPGLVDAHTHVTELGAGMQQVRLTGLSTEEQMVDRVEERAKKITAGQWILGYGWDEGKWADEYPTMTELSSRVPNHPVYLKGLHGFAVWGNRLAFQRAGITSETESPEGGEILKDADGNPTGVLLNRARTLLETVLPESKQEQLEARIISGLDQMASSGFVMVHEAGTDRATTAAYENLANRYQLPIRVSAMLSSRNQKFLNTWLKRGPVTLGGERFFVRTVKAYYDGALGSRGALLLEGYSDHPDHQGIGGADYGFDETMMATVMRAGFQLAIHAIGDAGNCETLNFFEWALEENPGAEELRHRIEHAQVIQPDDFHRFAEVGVIASMQPAHAVEDQAWAEHRLGPERIEGAYAWRTLRQSGVPLVLSSDMPGSDHSIFYGLHAAITRQDKQRRPPGGWFIEQRLTSEEALRGYTSWAASSALLELTTGTLAPGNWADITVMDIDPLVVGEKEPEKLLDGEILITIVGGQPAFMR